LSSLGAPRTPVGTAAPARAPRARARAGRRAPSLGRGGAPPSDGGAGGGGSPQGRIPGGARPRAAQSPVSHRHGLQPARAQAGRGGGDRSVDLAHAQSNRSPGPAPEAPGR